MMKLLYFVLNDTEKLDDILIGFLDNGIKDVSILEDQSMIPRLKDNRPGEEEKHLLNTIRMFMKPEWETSKLILAVLEDDQVSLAIDAIEKCIGDLNNENTGKVFTLPIDFVKGLFSNGE